MLKIAVTGASGFIGHQVVQSLVARQDIEVVAIVRSSKESLPKLKAVSYMTLDIATSHITYDQLRRPDLLIHLAWDGLPNYHSLHHFEQQLPKHYNFLKKLIETGLPALFVAGTCFEYGMQSGELDETLGAKPTNPYGFAKDMLRQQLEYLQKQKAFNLTWSRLFYIFGLHQGERSIYRQLLSAVESKASTFNMSKGEQLRDYLSVDEVAQYIIKIAFMRQNIGIINICSGTPISVRALVEKWLVDQNYQLKLNLGYYPYPDYEPMAFWGNRDKLDYYLAVDQ